jgi:hypothetical protein
MQAAIALIALLALVVSDLGELRASGASAQRPGRQLQVPTAQERERPAFRSVGGGKVVAEVFHELTDAQARERVRAVGGVVTGEVPGILVQANVPLDRIRELESGDGVLSVSPPRNLSIERQASASQVDANRRRRRCPRRRRPCRRPPPTPPTPPTPPVGAIVGEELQKTNTAAWHAAGRRGAGVKVGIIDQFSAAVYSASQRRGEVPAPAGTFCRFQGSPCDALELPPDVKHGTAVAEVIHEQAPDAQLFLTFAETAADYNALVDFFIAQGVKIVSRSIGSPFDGSGKGDGPFNAVVDRAVAAGITWFEAAGNAAGPPGGAYHRSTFTDTDGDGIHEWAPGTEIMDVDCGSFALGLRWDDFGEASVTDYDLVAVDFAGNVIETAVDNVTRPGSEPIENFATQTIPCRTSDPVGGIGLIRQSAGQDTTDTIEFSTNNALSQRVQFPQNAFSAAVPVCDSKSPGLVCVGAVDPALGTVLGSYSSQGPTNDGRIKPELSAASCVKSFANPPCFDGTSASTPVASGAAALVLGAGLVTTPASLSAFMRTATVDRGAPGPDNQFGAGELVLPAP